MQEKKSFKAEDLNESGMSSSSSTGVYDIVWECTIPYVQDPRDRSALSLVCKRCYEIEAITRKHVTIALCYTTTPQCLSRRFPHLEYLKLKGKPRAAMFNLIPEDWGGYATPWMEEIVRSFRRMKALHFRRMIVKDSDLEMLANSVAGTVLEVLKLDKCSGFSTDGLLIVGRLCRSLKIFVMEESTILEKDGDWLHELATNNTVLETLNFYMTDLVRIKSEDIELVARNCKSLSSMKISDFDISNLIGFFQAATSLEEFAGGTVDALATVTFPPRVCSLGLTYLGCEELHLVFPVASKLKKLDLLYALLNTDDHCRLLQMCPNLEFLEARNVLGDRGLMVIAMHCKRMKRLRIERGADEQGMEDVEGRVSHEGLMALAQGCLDLQYLAVYANDISNAALECIGTYLKNLYDFRLVLLDREEIITDLPLDNGVRTLLRGCPNLRRFALYLRPGGLTDLGLHYIGQYSPQVRWMLLGYVGESDEGLIEFSKGCPRLQKLEMRGCCFSESAVARAALQLTSLRYLWVQGFRASINGRDLLSMVRPFWNIEIIPAKRVIVEDPVGQQVILEHPAHILAYYSLAGPRTDFPDSVKPLDAQIL